MRRKRRRILGSILILGSTLSWVLAFSPTVSAGEGGKKKFSEHQPGEYSFSRVDFNGGRVDVLRPGSSDQMLSVRHFGVIFYPTDPGTEGPELASGGPFPLVVFGHGRFQIPPFEGQNHAQAKYLLRHLASHGFIAVSVNLDVVGQFAAPAAIPQRGELIHRTIDHLEVLHQNDASRFFGQVDLTRIGLVGHSRGGEGVVAAALENPQGRSIRGVFSIAPTDFEGYDLSGVPYYVLYGSRDGDVNNGWPIRLYDRAAPLKGFVFVHGASHFHFTDSISFDPADFRRRAHHIIARTLVTTWLKTTILDEDDLFPFATFDRAIPHGAQKRFEVYPMFEHFDKVVVDDFEDEPADLNSNSLGEEVSSRDLLFFAERNMNDGANTLFHETRGVRFGWDYSRSEPNEAFYASQLGSSVDLDGFPFLSLRACQRYDEPENPRRQFQDFTVVLTDDQGRRAGLSLMEFGGIPYPYRPPRFGLSIPVKSVMRTFRLPLERFREENPDLALENLVEIRLACDRNASGKVFVDSLEFTR